MGPFFVIFLLWSLWITAAERYIESNSLLTCMENSQLTSSYFNVRFTPSDNNIDFDITALSTISGEVEAHVELIVYGITVVTENLALCDLGYAQLCPLAAGHIEVNSNYQVSSSLVNEFPNVLFTIPDLDARVRVIVYSTSNNTTPLACVEAVLSNGKTVQTKYAAWPIAAISGLGLVTSGVISIVGHSNTAAHIASNSLSLFIYFQGVAITSMMGVSRVPPIAAAWAQNFVFSLGIVQANVLQSISNWYVQATGGVSTSILHNTQTMSISVQKKIKRDLSSMIDIYKRPSLDSGSSFSDDLDDTSLYTTDEYSDDLRSRILVLRGVQRVAFLAGIEISDIFMTGIIFFLFFGFIVLVLLFLFKGIIELLVRTKAMKEGKYLEFRRHWGSITKGVLYRLALLALPQISLLSLWEFTVNDSPACMAVAACFLFMFVVLLLQAAIRLFLIARNSIKLYKNPAYLLFGDAKVLNRFGFLYVQFRADKYYWIFPTLLHSFIRSLFVAVLQEYGKVQSVLVFAVELIYLVILCWKRPFMDKRTNVFNILIAVVNFINSIFYMFFSNIFGQPPLVSSIMAVVLFVLNAVFSAVLLIFTIVTCVLAIVYKNPDTRYQPMKDDRVSFLPRAEGDEKNQDMELMALGATAMRGHDRNSMMPDQSKHLDQLTSLEDGSSSSVPFNKRENPYSNDNSLSSETYYGRDRLNSLGSSINNPNGGVVPTSVVGGANTSYQGYQDSASEQRRGYGNEYNRGIRWN